MALFKHVYRVFSKYRYNDEEFVKTISIGMTTNHNESMHHLLREMVPKKERAGLDAIKLGAALASSGTMMGIKLDRIYSEASLNLILSYARRRHFVCLIIDGSWLAKFPARGKTPLLKRKWMRRSLVGKEQCTGKDNCIGIIPGPNQ